jgi:hypothetical protein
VDLRLRFGVNDVVFELEDTLRLDVSTGINGRTRCFDWFLNRIRAGWVDKTADGGERVGVVEVERLKRATKRWWWWDGWTA